MGSNVGTLALFLLTLLTLLVLIKFFHKMWWVPTRIKHALNSQGIKGPPYRFIDGNIKEIATMKDQATRIPFTNISHDIYPSIQPHFVTWFHLYGSFDP